MRSSGRPCIWPLLLLLIASTSASAQTEPVGVRAAGMGGAFTAVADDASAAFWNPAGFAAGSYFSLVADANILDRRSAVLVALGTPPLGISYYRTAIAEVKKGRKPVVAHHAGVTLVQSLGGRLAVGTTLKLVHGIVSAPGGAEISTNTFDADLGVLATGSLGQLGLSVRNLLQPELKTPGGAVRLDRIVRAGVSVHAGQETTIAADIDLTTAAAPRGTWRAVAGGRGTPPRRKARLRSGGHWNAAPLGGSAAAAEKAGAAPVTRGGAGYPGPGPAKTGPPGRFGAAQ